MHSPCTEFRRRPQSKSSEQSLRHPHREQNCDNNGPPPELRRPPHSSALSQRALPQHFLHSPRSHGASTNPSAPADRRPVSAVVWRASRVRGDEHSIHRAVCLLSPGLAPHKAASSARSHVCPHEPVPHYASQTHSPESTPKSIRCAVVQSPTIPQRCETDMESSRMRPLKRLRLRRE